MTIGDKIRNERINRNLSQSELAEKVGVTQSAIALIENNNRGASDELKVKLATFFDTTVQNLFFTHNNYK